MLELMTKGSSLPDSRSEMLPHADLKGTYSYTVHILCKFECLLLIISMLIRISYD